MAPLRSAGAVESEAGSPVMNHFLNTGAEGINHREEGFEESRGSAQVYAHPSPPPILSLHHHRNVRSRHQLSR